MWLDHLSPFDVPFTEKNAHEAVAQALNELAAQHHVLASVQFEGLSVPLKALEYEGMVARGAVPTRDCAHDWYNGLVWLAFPESKALVNHLHMLESKQTQSVGNGRTARRDALTLFDENGALLVTSSKELIHSLYAFDWGSVFGELRSVWGKHARLCVFGHGLLEAMDKPHKGLCAKVLCVLVDDVDLAVKNLDVHFQQQIADLLSSRQLQPLPVMGVPSWFADSETPHFYEDLSVFRPKPTHRL